MKGMIIINLIVIKLTTTYRDNFESRVDMLALLASSIYNTNSTAVLFNKVLMSNSNRYKLESDRKKKREN